MLLSQLQKGAHGIITKINASNELKNRFFSFGIMRGEDVEIKECSIGRQTIEVEVGSTLIALRIDEAEQIEIDTNSH